MDLRTKKTVRAITNAFLQIRSKKTLERITVKELAELAEISKATFYLHYRDIYDLSETLQNEVIQKVLKSIQHPEYCSTNISYFTYELFHAFYAQQNLIEILFSGEQSSVLPMNIEKELRAYIEKVYPEHNTDFDILLTYTIQGGYYAYKKYSKVYDLDSLISLVGTASDATMRTAEKAGKAKRGH